MLVTLTHNFHPLCTNSTQPTKFMIMPNKIMKLSINKEKGGNSEVNL